MSQVITDAQYIKSTTSKENEIILCKINGVECSVPLDVDNYDYAEILKQVADGTLTIKEAEAIKDAD